VESEGEYLLGTAIAFLVALRLNLVDKLSTIFCFIAGRSKSYLRGPHYAWDVEKQNAGECKEKNKSDGVYLTYHPT
jgi:hypothetical protein